MFSCTSVVDAVFGRSQYSSWSLFRESSQVVQETALAALCAVTGACTGSYDGRGPPGLVHFVADVLVEPLDDLGERGVLRLLEIGIVFEYRGGLGAGEFD